MHTHQLGVPKEEYSQSRPTLISLETAVKMYHPYQHTVKSTIDGEKLINFNVKQGWDPQCPLTILGVECPDSRKGILSLRELNVRRSRQESGGCLGGNQIYMVLALD
jgi:hypothetical protein